MAIRPLCAMAIRPLCVIARAAAVAAVGWRRVWRHVLRGRVHGWHARVRRHAAAKPLPLCVSATIAAHHIHIVLLELGHLGGGGGVGGEGG